MACILNLFRRFPLYGERKKEQSFQSIYSYQMHSSLGLQIRFLKSTADICISRKKKVGVVIDSPILKMLFRTKIFETEDSTSAASEAEDPRIQGSITVNFGGFFMHQAPETDPESDETLAYNQLLYGNGEEPVLTHFADFSSDTEDPIPPEYKTTHEFFNDLNRPTPSQAQTTNEPTSEEKTALESLKRKPLAAEYLKPHTESFKVPTIVPPGPYPYMKNPEHEATDNLELDEQGTVMTCWDGCPDCEVFPSEVHNSTVLVNAWFNAYFTFDDVLRALKMNPSDPSLGYIQFADGEDTGNTNFDEDKDDYLLGASDQLEFMSCKALRLDQYDYVYGSGCDNLTMNMLKGDAINWELLCYHHGPKFNTIMAEYEPRFLPKWGSSPFQVYAVLNYPGITEMDIPIWEARGCPEPQQGDHAVRMEYARKEYNRQWALYRQQDEARQRYIANVVFDARQELFQRGLLTLEGDD